MRKSYLVLCAALAILFTDGNSFAQLGGKGLVINEIYIGSFASSGGATDQYVELYNPQSTTQYLDANMLVRFGTGGRLSGSALQQVAEAWKFPGKPGGKTLAVAPGQFIVIAATAKNWSGKTGLDLSHADYETYTGGMVADEDNPNSINLHKLTAALTVTDLQLSSTMDAIVLTNGLDSNIADGINLSTVIDGVQYNTAWTAGNLPASIDAGFTGGPNLKYGYAMERAKQGVTTLNSTSDFSLQYPSPGFEHGGSQQKLLTVADLMPSNLNRFVDYNEFDTVTAGAAPNVGVASKTVSASGIQFQGQNGVATVRGTSLATGVSDLHYLPTPAGDMQVFADQSFVGSVLPTSGLGITFTVPNQFVDYFKLSAGIGTTYPVATVTGVTTQSGTQVNFTITTTGIYRGVERNIRVPGGVFDSAYRFDLPAAVQISALNGLISGNFTATQSFWLVKGIGIVKSVLPRAGTTLAGNSIVVGGIEKEMTAYGIQGVRSTVEVLGSTDAFELYPNPVSEKLSMIGSNGALTLYYPDGRMALMQNVSRNGEVDVQQLPNGAYLARIEHSDGTAETRKLIVRH